MTAFCCDLSVIGAGSYGTALAVAVSSKGLKVILWDRVPEIAALMQERRVNAQFLDGITLPPTLEVTADLQRAVESSQVILLVIPSHAFKEVLTEIVPWLGPEHCVAWAAKGLDFATGSLLSEIAQQTVPFQIPLAALSGPTFARELASGMPTAISVAGTSGEFTASLCKLMHTPTFRIYESSDLIGLQLGGAVKNVIAIGAGLSDGLGYGANARTALITRGLAEMVRLGVAKGASERSFMGLSGLGDLILTCTDDKSRNRRFGRMLGQGIAPEEALRSIGQVVEGYKMTVVVRRLAQQYGVQMPICCELYEVLYNGKNGRAAARTLLSRELTVE